MVKIRRLYTKEIARKSYDEESDPRHKDILYCAMGSNSFGTSERVIEFAKKYDWTDLWCHPDNSYKELKREICKFWSAYANLGIQNLKVANGSIIVQSRLNRLFLEQGAKVLGYAPQFKESVDQIEISGAYYEAVPLEPSENFKFNPEKLIRKMSPNHCMIYIDNPNNPTGQLISLSNVESIVREGKRKDSLVLIDEAYGEYIEEKHSAVQLVNRYQNLVVTRTFSKGYGIGGFRVGYAVLSDDLSQYYDRVDIPFPVSTMGAALAREALLDQEFILNLRQKVSTEKGKLTQALRRRGYIIGETCGYCPLFILGHKDRNTDLKKDLLGKGILTTPGYEYENLGKNYVRVNTPRNADEFLVRLEQ